ncbi:MAG: hypothetical protein N7Q72_06870, partial [Spiroplasma sp. Tabriz.8]|nr:hypothetical protein [Spiroplasma sp. Tabriz.8]
TDMLVGFMPLNKITLSFIYYKFLIYIYIYIYIKREFEGWIVFDYSSSLVVLFFFPLLHW